MATLAVAASPVPPSFVLGVVGGVGGYFLEQTISAASTTYYDQTGNITSQITNAIQGVVGSVGSDVVNFLGGGFEWYVGAAGLGLATSIVTGYATNTTIFPFVASVGSGIGLGMYNTSINPPVVPASVNQQQCANGDMKGCTIKNPDGSRNLPATVQNAFTSNIGKILTGAFGGFDIFKNTFNW